MSNTPAALDEEFSLVLGGPLYQLLVRGRLLQPPLRLLRRRLVSMVVVTWLPLALLSALEGQALWAARGLPFFQDLEVQARFLLALPLLIVAEVLVHQRIGPAVRLFVERGIVREADRGRFHETIVSTERLRNSLAIELILIAFVFTGGHYLWQEQLAMRAETWSSIPTASGPDFSKAGLWYAWVSVPIFQFLLVRWYFRIVLWCRFLWRVSRFDLDLVPAHPDRAGGLGFLGTSTYAFAPLLASQSVVISAMVGSRVLQEGVPLQSFKFEIVGCVLVALVQALGPLLVFTPGLAAAKRRGLGEYGNLANHYVRGFNRKWLGGEAPPDEPLVGSADIQSLADMDSAYGAVREMRPFPFGKQTVAQLVTVTIVPLLPLVLIVIPFEELIRRVLGALL